MLAQVYWSSTHTHTHTHMTHTHRVLHTVSAHTCIFHFQYSLVKIIFSLFLSVSCFQNLCVQAWDSLSSWRKTTWTRSSVGRCRQDALGSTRRRTQHYTSRVLRNCLLRWTSKSWVFQTSWRICPRSAAWTLGNSRCSSSWRTWNTATSSSNQCCRFRTVKGVVRIRTTRSIRSWTKRELVTLGIQISVESNVWTSMTQSLKRLSLLTRGIRQNNKVLWTTLSITSTHATDPRGTCPTDPRIAYLASIRVLYPTDFRLTKLEYKAAGQTTHRVLMLLGCREWQEAETQLQRRVQTPQVRSRSSKCEVQGSIHNIRVWACWATGCKAAECSALMKQVKGRRGSFLWRRKCQVRREMKIRNKNVSYRSSFFTI